MVRNRYDRCALQGEFHAQTRVYVLWPTRPDNWRENARFGQMAMHDLIIKVDQLIEITVGFPTGEDPRHKFVFPSSVQFAEMQYDDIWIRDTGPMVINPLGKSSIFLDYRFNSWGGLFGSSNADDSVAREIARLECKKAKRIELVLEGGAIISDGYGTIITTKESLIGKSRNPNHKSQDIDRIFEEEMGTEQTIWLPTGLANDEAGGHIDNVCLFADRNTLLLSHTSDKLHPSFQSLQAANQLLSGATNSDGDPYDIVLLPLPPEMEITKFEASGFARSDGTIRRESGTPLAASYANSLITNSAVIVPVFGCHSDQVALNTMSFAFPDRTIIAFQSREFLLGGGAIHCLTKQIPANRNEKGI